MASLVYLLNEAKRGRELSRCPYVMVGDPSGRRLGRATMDDRGSVAVPPGSSVLYFDRHGNGSAPTAVHPSLEKCRVIVGESCGVAIMAGAHEPRRLELIDMSAEVASIRSRARELFLRLLLCARVERCIWATQEHRFAELPRMAEQVAKLSDARLRVELCLDGLCGKLESVREYGVWDPEIRALELRIGSAIGAWDRAMAALIFEHLQTGQLPHVLRHGYARGKPTPAGPCTACGSDTFSYRLVDRYDRTRGIEATICIACGDRETRQAAALAFTLRMPRSLTTGDQFTIELCLDGAGISKDLSGYFVFGISDPTDKRIYAEAMGELSGGGMRLEGRIPKDARPDSQRVQVALVSNLAVSAFRCLYPVVPPGTVT